MAHWREGGIGNMPGDDDRSPEEIAAARAADVAHNAAIDEVIRKLPILKRLTPWLEESDSPAVLTKMEGT